ncbi:tetraacyldisaccharide 4'-kinase [Desulfurivibrio dismutans]|uniref:tetraacyldisaccharide 4'-kinase n=1 Tax=Desulfurivibrio dismutans TaxID=1398908 RepID=UPI0023DCC675|nr:tetraacyldisaccharide 4'-kinase [Desulfurivibrio alkaliphilus]MDF1614776.1 tetraacyldisaccharide 4'-kinase [Desulfurivibrio alkaliphilus]
MGSHLDLLFVLGRPLAPLYAGLMRLRAWLYRRGWWRREKMRVPVISVGNLTLGGTGKTPLVLYLARLLKDVGGRPAVLSRGYGRPRRRGGDRHQPLVVADGRQLLQGPEAAGDEPVLLARSLPGVPVLVGVRRAASGRYAVERLGADSLILDDGFQHLALDRDLDLALFSARNLPLRVRVFPGGPLREPWSALGRADAVVITGVTPESLPEVAAFQRFLKVRWPQLPCFTGEYRPVCLLVGGFDAAMALDQGKGQPLYGFAGIAQPQSFRQTLLRVGYRLNGFRAFADHHHYTAADYRGLVQAARQQSAAALITTEKDLVKLAPLTDDFPLLALRVSLFMEEAFDRFIRLRLSIPHQVALPPDGV